MNNELINTIIEKVCERLEEQTQTFQVEASGRHVHLSEEHLHALFGENYQLTLSKYLSQPGQYAAKERVTLIGPKGSLHNVVILGPTREASQVEISLTDATALGIKTPVRESGKIEGTPGIIIANGDKVISLDKGLIVAKRHIHVAEKDQARLGVTNGEIVNVRVESEERSLIFDDVVIRVSPKFSTSMHIDYDEANACGLTKTSVGKIVK